MNPKHSPDAASTAEGSVGSKSQAAEILVIDDDITRSRRLAEILSQGGYRVEQTGEPQAALEAVRACPPGLILLNVSLPGMSGFEVCRRLKQDERTKEVPVIFVNASDDVEDRVKGFEAGGVDFVSTSCHSSAVLARVRTHLQLRRTQRHLEELIAQHSAESRARNDALKEEVQARTRAQQALRDNENKYRAVVEGAREGILVMQDNQRKYCNPAWLDMIGYTAEEYAPIPFLSLVHPDDLEFVANAYHNLLEGEEFGTLPAFRIVTKSGDTKWLAIQGARIEWEGRPAGMVFIEDITERKRAEDVLQESEEQYRALVEHARDGIVVIQEGKIRFANAYIAELIGYTVEDLLDTPFIGFLSPDEVQRAVDVYRERMEGEAVPAVYELTLQHRDGSRVYVEVNAGLTMYEGSPADLVFIRDITERKVVEQQIMEYQRRLQALASQLTLSEEQERRRIARELHDEVGQRLTFARMALASARETTSEARREAILDDVSQSVRQAIGEIRDLTFDLSSPLMNEVGLAAALEEWLENQVGKKHGLQVRLVNDGRRLSLDDDVRAMLFRSTRELVTNVVKHAQAGSVIVRLEGEGTMVRIMVEDDGIGFDLDALSQATERGSGFGLFSIQERMAALGGSLEVLSAPGQGCKAILITPGTIQ